MPVFNPFVEGLRFVGPRCPDCGERLRWAPAVDARYCRGCDTWAEPPCWSPGCSYCWSRPARPSGLPFPELGNLAGPDPWEELQERLERRQSR